MDQETYNKKSLITLFIQLSKSDNVIAESELLFIETMRKRLDIPAGQVEELWADDQLYPLKPPVSER